jgi:hypothetical protein
MTTISNTNSANETYNIPTATIVSIPSAPPQTTIRNDDYASVSETYYVETMPEEKKLQNCWRYGKTTKLLACIDSFFCILNAIFDYPIFFLFALMPLCGYYGAKNYDLLKIAIYVFYCLMLSVGRIIQLDNVINSRYNYVQNYSSDHKTTIYVINIISIIVQLWITWIVFKFYSLLLRLTSEEKNKLLVGTYIPVVHTYLFH